MAKLLFIKVKDGLIGLRNPLDNQLLVPGKIYEMPESQFWLRRLKCGDVFLADQDAVKDEKPKVKSKKGE